MSVGNFVTSIISINELSNNVLVDIKKKDVENAVNNLYQKIRSPLKAQIIKAFSIPQGKTNDVSQELMALINQAVSGKDNLIEEIEQRQKHKFVDESIKDAISNHIRLMFENTQTALMLGKIVALNNSDCNKYEYKCADNSSVCANCRALKDKIFDSENATIGVNFPPIHPYCRCDIVGINADGVRVQFDDGNSYTPEILNEIRGLLTALWKSTQTRTDKAFNEPNFYNISNYLTIGAFDAIKNMFLQNGTRGEKAFSNPSVYNVGNWLSSGLFDTIKETFMPEKPLSLQHWLDSLSTVLMTTAVVQKAGNLIDDVGNGVYNGKSNAIKIYSANGDAELRATRRPIFDNWLQDGVEVNGQTFKMNPHANNSLFKSGRKDIMPDDITDALVTKSQPAQNGSVQYINPTTGTSIFVNPATNEIVGIWPSDFGK